VERGVTKSRNPYEIHDWVWQLRKRGSPVQEAIRKVSDRFKTAEGEEHRDLGFELGLLLGEAGRYDEKLLLHAELMDRYPNDVRSAISRAMTFFYGLGDSDEALRCINVAVDRARRTGFFRREALGDKARILLELGRGDELSDVLEEIMSLQMTKDIPDIARERDFVDRAPPGFIREDVLVRYNQFRPKRPDDTNEPPKYEPSDD
jgi:tetratricopeptide (TPR) repeat protein